MSIVVDFKTAEEIEACADALLTSFERKYGTILQPPVPVEEIIERHLRLHFDMMDFGTVDVLGFLDITQNRIVINEQLDPTQHPHLIGRFRFTSGHEIGHNDMHRAAALDYLKQTEMFGAEKTQRILCRQSESKAPIEYQADQYASCLIMPRRFLVNVIYHGLNGYSPTKSLGQVILRTMCKQGAVTRDMNNAIEQSLRPIAQLFQVSSQALRIRLQKIGILEEYLTQHRLV